MNINNIAAINQIESAGRYSRESLSEAKKAQVSAILENYDSESLSSNDIKNIQQAFRDAKIRPTADLRDAITAAGFDPAQLRSTDSDTPANKVGGARPGPPPPPPSGNGVDLQKLQSLKEILESVDLTQLDSASSAELISKLNAGGYARTGVFVDLSA